MTEYLIFSPRAQEIAAFYGKLLRVEPKQVSDTIYRITGSDATINIESVEPASDPVNAIAVKLSALEINVESLSDAISTVGQHWVRRSPFKENGLDYAVLHDPDLRPVVLTQGWQSYYWI